MTDRAAMQAALGGTHPSKPRATGDPGGWKRCTDACIKVEAKLAVGCICPWFCFKKNKNAKTQHIRQALDWRCLVHSATAKELRDD